MANVSLQLDAKALNILPSVASPELVLQSNTGATPFYGYSFPAAFDTQGFYEFKVPSYLSGNITLNIVWYARLAVTTGNVRWSVQMFAITPGDAANVLNRALAAAQTTTTATNATGQGSALSTVTISNLDSVAAGDVVQLRILRDTTVGSNLADGAVIFDVEVVYAATGTGGDVIGPASSVNNRVATFNGATGKLIQDGGRTIGVLVVGPGSATDNALTRYDGTTGVLVQDSAVLVADTTGAITGPAGFTVTADRFIGPATGLRETGGPTDLVMDVVNDDRALFRSGTSIFGKQLGTFCYMNSSYTVTTSLADVTDLVLGLNGGTKYSFDFDFGIIQLTAGITYEIGLAYTGTCSAYYFGVTVATGVTAVYTSGKEGSAVPLGAVTTSANVGVTAVPQPCRISGTINTTTFGNLTVQVRRTAATGTGTVRLGGKGICFEQ